MSESEAPRRGVVRAFATVLVFAIAWVFATALPFADAFALTGAEVFAFTADDFALALVFFAAGFRFFDFLGAVFFLAMPGV